MTTYHYKWTKPYAVDAQVAGEIVQRCGNADALLKEAASTKCPLHSIFEWDNSEAGRQYRLVQARVMIASLRVEVVNGERKSEHIAAFVSTIDRLGFVPTLEANAEELTAAEQQCWRDASRFRQKWKGLKFAREIIEIIAEKARTIERKGRSSKSARA